VSCLGSCLVWMHNAGRTVELLPVSRMTEFVHNFFVLMQALVTVSHIDQLPRALAVGTIRCASMENVCQSMKMLSTMVMDSFVALEPLSVKPS